MKYFSLLLFLLMVQASAAAAESPRFLPGFDGVPLMPGLSLLDEEALLFDTPEGRIAQVHAEGSASLTGLETFYGTALPQLGWRRGPAITQPGAEGLIYRREGERLTILLETGPQPDKVIFYLSPLPEETKQ